MTTRRVLLGTLLAIVGAIVAAGAAVSLALTFEGEALQHGFFNGTPGLIASRLLVPPTGLSALSKGMQVQVSVDASINFLIIGGIAIFIARRRAKNKLTP
jgi:hypothetical protein